MTVNGTDIFLKFQNHKISKQTNCSFSISQNVREIISEDSAWVGCVAGDKSWEMSGEAEFAFDALNGFSDIFNALQNNDEVNVQMYNEIVDGKYLTGKAIINNLLLSAGVEADVKLSYNFKSNGKVEFLDNLWDYFTIDKTDFTVDKTDFTVDKTKFLNN